MAITPLLINFEKKTVFVNVFLSNERKKLSKYNPFLRN